MNIQQSYREAAIRGANPIALIVRLYEQMIEDMRHVAIAIEQNDIQLRSDRIKHVLVVIGHLQSSLDFERGGKVARDLNTFYDALRENIMWVQFHPSKRAATQVITDLLAVREAWIEVERHEYPSAPATAQPAAYAAPVSAEREDSHRASQKPSPYVSRHVSQDVSRIDWKG
jgi:flagellar secretion chaperone FliS